MANSSRLKDRPSQISERGIATLYKGSLTISRSPEEPPAVTMSARTLGMSSCSDSLLCLKPINGVPITRIPRFDGVAIQWLDIVRAQPAETVGQRQVEQDHEIMQPWNIEAPRGEPALQVFLHALLCVKAHGVERTILVAKGERVFRVSQIVLRLFDPLSNVSGHLTRLGHTGHALRAPQAVRPTRSDDGPVQTLRESRR